MRALVDDVTYRQFRDEIELLEGAGESFDRDAMLSGAKTPVFFGSAVTNFGVQLFLDAFVGMAPSPVARQGIRLYITGASPAVRRALITHGVVRARATYRETIARAVADIRGEREASPVTVLATT